MWAETANAFEPGERAVRRLTTEWAEIVCQHRSHPSIVTRVPFTLR